MSTFIDLTPGATFRHLVTMFEQGRDGPRMDLTGAVITCINLDPAPWDIVPLMVDAVNGQFQLWIDSALTQEAEPYAKYAFQMRFTFPSGDKMIVSPLTIATGAGYLDASPPLPLAAE